MADVPDQSFVDLADRHDAMLMESSSAVEPKTTTKEERAMGVRRSRIVVVAALGAVLCIAPLKG